MSNSSASTETVASVTDAKKIDTKDEDHFIIFDWDDTLLSSSWLHQKGLGLASKCVPEGIREELKALEESCCKLLDRALASSNKVVIITNAELGWVELSCEKFLPRVLPFLQRIKVCSARSYFESMYPDNPAQWKIQAFHQEIS